MMYELKDFLWSVAEYSSLAIVFIGLVYFGLYFVNKIRDEVRKM